MGTNASPSDRDDVRPVREERMQRYVRYLSRGKKRLQEQQYGLDPDASDLQTMAQLSIRGGEFGGKDKMPQWASGRQDPSTDAQRTLRGRTHERWQQLTQDRDPYKKNWQLAPGHVELEDPVEIVPDESNGFAYLPGNSTAGDERGFYRLHRITRLPDRNGNPSSHFNGSTTPYNKSANRMGYDTPQDKLAYDQGRAFPSPSDYRYFQEQVAEQSLRKHRLKKMQKWIAGEIRK
jgi:hypothetical protein